MEIVTPPKQNSACIAETCVQSPPCKKKSQLANNYGSCCSTTLWYQRVYRARDGGRLSVFFVAFDWKSDVPKVGPLHWSWIMYWSRRVIRGSRDLLGCVQAKFPSGLLSQSFSQSRLASPLSALNFALFLRVGLDIVDSCAGMFKFDTANTDWTGSVWLWYCHNIMATLKRPCLQERADWGLETPAVHDDRWG